jgi:hypothetical protein
LRLSGALLSPCHNWLTGGLTANVADCYPGGTPAPLLE